MKLSALLLCLFSFVACQQNSQVGVEASSSLTSPVAQKIAIKDSIPPVKNKTRYIVDTSRPDGEMDKQFPYDISVMDIEGKKLNTSTIFQNNGKPTVLMFWLTTCYPCRVELAAIKKEFPAWKEETDFNLFAISTDFPMNYDKFVNTVKKNEWPFPAFHDTNREFRKVMKGGLNGLPQVFVLNEDGEVVYHKRKYQTGDEHTLYAQVKALAKK